MRSRAKNFAGQAMLAIVAAAATYACYSAAGPTLGLFFGGFVVATIVVPASVLIPSLCTQGEGKGEGTSLAIESNSPSPQPSPWVQGEGAGLVMRLIRLACVTASIAVVWLIAVFKTPDTITEWFKLSIALLAYAGAIAGISIILKKIKFAAPIASAIAIFLGLAWLTWPIWLGSTLASSGADHLTAWLVWAHPPLTANGVLINESPWTERALAYQWTNLNQDIPTELPSSALPCIILHGLIASILFTLASLKVARASRP